MGSSGRSGEDVEIMGLFGKKTNEQTAEDQQKKADKQQKKAALQEQQQAKLEAKAREKAAKKGLDVDGAVVVAHDLNKDTAWETLVVWPDRVEKHNHGKVGSVFGSGKGVETIPIGNVSSVEARNDGVYGKVEVHGSGNTINFRTSQPQARKIRGVVMDLMLTAKAAPQTTAEPSLAEQIKQLGELRDAGLVTEGEFEAKKKELLDRM